LEAYEYDTLFRFESSYWWYKGLHNILVDVLHELGCDANALFLDAGCGTGQNLVNVGNLITSKSWGFDIAAEVTRYWAKRSLSTVCRASINDIPFANDTFDVVMSVDVLECAGVDEGQAYAEMWRVLKKGGYLVMVVPAYDWLMAEQHHRAVHACRRYSVERLKVLLGRRAVEIVRMTHLFAALLPAVAMYRLVLARLRRRRPDLPTSDLRPLPSLLNNLLLQVVNVERRVLRSFDLPIGSSILAVARKIG
jgi:SAM-dependent methyltransferase